MNSSAEFHVQFFLKNLRYNLRLTNLARILFESLLPPFARKDQKSNIDHFFNSI